MEGLAQFFKPLVVASGDGAKTVGLRSGWESLGVLAHKIPVHKSRLIDLGSLRVGGWSYWQLKPFTTKDTDEGKTLATTEIYGKRARVQRWFRR